MSALRLARIALNSVDPGRLAAFYRAALGFTDGAAPPAADFAAVAGLPGRGRRPSRYASATRTSTSWR